MSEEKPPAVIGRGGRGAMLLAALQNQPRRPGQSAVPADESSQPKILGRGSVLSLLAQGRGRGILQQPSPDPIVSDPPQRVGRGRGLALLNILSEARAKPATSSCAPPVERSETSPSEPYVPSLERESLVLPTSEFEKLSINKQKGTTGEPISLEVNYVHLKTFKDKGIHEYHVDFMPLVDSKNMKFRLMNDPIVKEVIGSVKMFDGSTLYLPINLTSPTNIKVELPTDKSIVTVCIKFVKDLKLGECKHLINLLFRKAMRILRMTQVGRNFYDAKGGIPVPQHKLEIWPGYITAVQEYEGGVMLNCDASFRVLRTITAREVMNDTSMKSRGNVREEVIRAIVGCVVLTRYNNKTYRVDDIAWDMNPTSTFSTSDGSEISFVDYYKRSYDIQIQDLNQPLLINKAKKKDYIEGVEPKLICLVPELCFMTGLTDDMRNDFKVMKDIAVYTRVRPECRQLTLQKFINNVRENPEARNCFKNWNVEVVERPVKLDGRVLPIETIYFGKGSSFSAGVTADWGRYAGTSNVLVPVHFVKWAVIYVKRDGAKVRDFVKMLRNITPQIGIDVREPQYIEIFNDRPETYCNAARDIINPTLQIIVAIFPTPRDDRYSAFKKLCCVEMPVPSQAINLRTISDARKLKSVVQKIALQMNCKLGGELWSVHIPMNDLMVCGMDTFHDISKGRRSVLAFVASLNQNRTRWFSMTTMQRQGQEFGDSLKILFLASLRKYFEVNHRLPEKIILFRDGVGVGQLQVVKNYEAEQLTSCFKHFSQDYSPSLTIAVVQKRINTRMYSVVNQGNRTTLDNPVPGTILDHTITHFEYDFFLVSQHVRQGTVSPTHYVVVSDSSTIKPDHMQRIAYKMTHLYYNWPGTVRVPAPCQYAHKLAYLVGQNLHRDTHSDLSDRLFYL
ncbi:piwi-like protein 2 [Nephila pilipes]|uniref:Piwi-like protein 2 n=1 Tax=Nephila pilipes TaxID=299642 RepID=A0A8X6IQ08_NEPPI|nr:piwi-like protein 2 [Nephila pilipes]